MPPCALVLSQRLKGCWCCRTHTQQQAWATVQIMAQARSQALSVACYASCVLCPYGQSIICAYN